MDKDENLQTELLAEIKNFLSRPDLRVETKILGADANRFYKYKKVTAWVSPSKTYSIGVVLESWLRG